MITLKTIKKLEEENERLEKENDKVYTENLHLEDKIMEMERREEELKKELQNYKEVYLKKPRDEIEKCLDDSFIAARDENITGGDQSISVMQNRYLKAYVSAIKKYGNGETKEAIAMIDKYKNEAIQCSTKLMQIQESKNILDKGLKELVEFGTVFQRRVNDIVADQS